MKDIIFSRLSLVFSIVALVVSSIACYIRGLDGPPGEKGNTGKTGSVVIQECLRGPPGKNGMVSTAFFNISNNIDDILLDTKQTDVLINKWIKYKEKDFHIYCIRCTMWCKNCTNQININNLCLNLIDSENEIHVLDNINLLSDHFMITLKKKDLNTTSVEYLTGVTSVTSEELKISFRNIHDIQLTCSEMNLNAYEITVDAY